ncbi:hypothetical protein COOONC_02090 [Cooperia oncophora]
MYEMLHGLPPFYSRDHNEMYNRIVNETLKFKRGLSTVSADIITGVRCFLFSLRMISRKVQTNDV